MKKILSTAITLIAACTALPACAQDDFYLGAAIGTRGNMDFRTSTGVLAALNKPRPAHIYGGFKFNENVAIEGGYSSFGEFKYTGDRKIDLSAWHLAAKGTIHMGESWNLFGKVGAVRHAVEVTGSGMPVREQNKITPMFGAGIGYKVTPNVVLDAALMNYGRIKTDTGRLAYRQLQVGANYSF